MFIIKLAGMVLIAFSCALVGFFKSNALASRCKKLSLLLDGVNSLYESIEQGGNTLDIAIKNSFKNCEFLRYEKGTFMCVGADLKNDKSLIEDFFGKLGSASKKVECDRINNFKIKLKANLKIAQNESEQRGKIYGTLGVCTGLIIVILLI